jgi:hypothetical protein
MHATAADRAHTSSLERAQMQHRAGANPASSGRKSSVERAQIQCRAGAISVSSGRKCLIRGLVPRPGRRHATMGSTWQQGRTFRPVQPIFLPGFSQHLRPVEPAFTPGQQNLSARSSLHLRPVNTTFLTARRDICARSTDRQASTVNTSRITFITMITAATKDATTVVARLLTRVPITSTRRVRRTRGTSAKAIPKESTT